MIHWRDVRRLREMFHGIERTAEIVHQNHIDRLDPPFADKLVPRPFKRRPTPKTSIIAEAAARELSR